MSSLIRKGYKVKSYTRYAWVGNRITQEDMARLYAIKERTRIPITKLVADAVKQYLLQREGEGVR